LGVKIKEKTLLKIALICALVGIAVIYFISINIEVEEKNIEDINLESLDEIIKLTGQINNLAETENAYFIEMQQPAKTTIVVFKDNKQNLTIAKGDFVEIIGQIQDYEGKPEVVAQRVRVVK